MRETSQTEGDFDLWFSYYCEDDSSPYHVAWVDFRYVDGNNMAYLAISPIGMYLDSVVSGQYTTAASNYDEDTVDGQWYDMYIQCSGETVEVWRGLPGEDMTRILSGTPTVIPAQAGTQQTRPTPHSRASGDHVF